MATLMCANCADEAVYTYRVSDDYLLNYCPSHLPRFLTSKKNAGLLPLVLPTETVVEEAPAKSPKKKVEEPVSEEVTDSAE